MLDFGKVAKDAHQVATENGWHEEERDWCELRALVVTEIAEFLEAARDGDPPDKHLPEFKSTHIELADTLIRLGDACIELGIDTDLRIGHVTDFSANVSGHNAAVVADTLISALYNRDLSLSIRACVIKVLVYCCSSRIDIARAVSAKMEFNRSRGYRHGGKVL